MIFLLRAAFWSAVVAVFAPDGTFHGAERGPQWQTLESLKTDAIHSLARVRAELNARDLRAP
jgi:hypothetical protein